MKSMKSALLAVFVTSALGAAAPVSAEDLAEVYQRALRSDPLLREAEANRLATLESRPQALANLLPQLNATGSWIRQDETLESLQQFSPTQITAIEREGDTDTTQWNVQLRQTLFRWDQFALYRAAGVEVAQAEVDFRNAQQDVITRAASAYFNVIAARDTLEAAEAAREAISRQLEQADKRFEVGLIAITDVQEARPPATRRTPP
jgi:outer membrane protein